MPATLPCTRSSACAFRSSAGTALIPHSDRAANNTVQTDAMQSPVPGGRAAWNVSSWNCVRPATSVVTPCPLTEFDDLSNRYPYMNKDLVEKYKQRANDRGYEEDSPLDDESGTESESEFRNKNCTSEEISHQAILSKAENIVLTRFTKVAKRRLPAARKPVKRRRMSVDIDNIDFYADDVPFATPKRSRKWKAPENIRDQDNDYIRPKRLYTLSDKENEIPSSPPRSLDDIAPYNIGMPLNLDYLAQGPFLPSRSYQQCSASPIVNAHKNISNNPEANASVMQPAVSVADLDRQSPSRNSRSSTTNRDIQFDYNSPSSTAATWIPQEKESLRPDSHSSSEEFSDSWSLFEELASQDVTAMQRDGFQSQQQVAQALTPPASVSSPSFSTRPTTQQIAIPANAHNCSTTNTPQLSTKKKPLTPFVRRMPMSKCTPSLLIGLLKPEARLITCFRIAEVLKLQSRARAEPVPIDTNPSIQIVIQIELFASIKRTTRRGLACVIEFHDMFFPDRPPFLVGVHESWRKVENHISTLREDVQKTVPMQNLPSRAVIVLQIESSRPPHNAMEVEVLNLRATDEEEIVQVRGIVDPQYQT